MHAFQSRTARRGGPILAATLALAWSVLAAAGEPAPPTTTISTTRPPPPVPQPAGVVQFDAFRGLDGPGHGDGQTPMEIGVAVGLATCPDGNTVVSGLNAGGWRHDIEDPCANSGAAPQGSVTLHQAPGPTAPAGGTTATPSPRPAAPPASRTAPAAQQTAPRCDPATWRCSTAPQ